MLLSKFPVISKNNNEYLIDIKDSHVACGMYQWKVDIYKRYKYTSWFTKEEKEKFKLLYVWNSGWNHYDDWDGRFKELAIMVVNEYEKSIQDKLEQEKRHAESLEEFNNWDGKC